MISEGLLNKWEPLNSLEMADVLEIHADQIRNYGGIAEVRDPGILESAIEQVST